MTETHQTPIPTPFVFSDNCNADFITRFGAYRLDVANHPIGTTKEGVHGSRTIELQRFLGHLRSFWVKHKLSWSCLQSTDAQGRVTTQHVWTDELGKGMVWTPPLAGSVAPTDDIPHKDGAHRTYAARRTLLLAHGVWPDGDYDGLTAMEWEQTLQEDVQNLVPGAKPVQPDQAPEAQAGADKAPEDAEAAQWTFTEGTLTLSGQFPSDKDNMQALMVLWRSTFNPAEANDDLPGLQALVDMNWDTFKSNMSDLGVQGMAQRLNKVGLTVPQDA